VLKGILQCSRRLVSGRILILLIEQTPASGSDDKPSCDLDHEQTDTKEVQNDTAEQKRNGKQHETISCNLACQNPLGRLWILLRESEEIGASPMGFTSGKSVTKATSITFTKPTKSIRYFLLMD